jgi:hypothetical protein
MVFTILTALALLGALIHIAAGRPPRDARRVSELLLVYVLVFCQGGGGIYAFIGHTFFADQVARGIGWPTGSPFQFEIAVSNLSFAVLGLMSSRLRGLFPVAAGIGYIIFLFGAAYGHLREIRLHGNYSPLNSGVFLYVQDILVPAVILVLIAAYLITRRSPSSEPTRPL